MKQAAEQIANQAEVNYLNYKKIKGFEDVGYFLASYVVSGGVVTKNIKHNYMIDVTDIVVSLNNDIMAREGTTFNVKIPNAIYYLDFSKDGDFKFGTAHPDGTLGSDFIQVATITTDSNGNVSTITDSRGKVGGFQTSPDYGIAALSTRSGDVADVKSKMQAGQTVKIVCYGDSITFGYKVGSGAQVANPYPLELQSKLRTIYNNNNISVSNNGHSGWRSEEAKNNVQEVVVQSPDICIVMFGINDCKGSSWGPPISVDLFKTNMEIVVNTLIANGIQVILCNTTPYIVGGNQNIKQYWDAIESVAKMYNLIFIDTMKEISKIFEQKFISNLNLLPDGIHFADNYYKYVAHVILKTLWQMPTAVPGDNHPVIYSNYVLTDCSVQFSDPNQFYGANYILRGIGGPSSGTYIRFPFFIDKKGVKIYILHPKTNTGTTMSVSINGTFSAFLDSYNATLIYDIETLISSDMEFGLNMLEMFSYNSTVAGPGGGWNNFVSAFSFKE